MRTEGVRIEGGDMTQAKHVRLCLCCGAATATPSIPACWDDWQLLPEELRCSIIRTSARAQLILYAKALTEAVSIWRNAAAWRPKRYAVSSHASSALQDQSNVVPVAVLQQRLLSAFDFSGDDRSHAHAQQTRTSPDAQRAAGKHELVLAVVRAVPAQCADKIRAADRTVGSGHIERQAATLRTLHGVRSQGRDAAASGVGR
jgi:hypothetical protein